MKRIFNFFIATILLISYFPNFVAADDGCIGIKQGQKIFWEGAQLVPGQIGKLAILKDTPLYSSVDGEMMEAKTLKKGSSYRIYTFKTEYLGVGGGYYVKRDEKVSYKTPSKDKLLAVKCANPAAPPGNTTVIQPQNLGPQVSNLSIVAARAGMDQSGNAYLYMSLQGTPAQLAVVELNTNEVRSTFNLENSTSAWAMDVDRDGILWIGGTTNGNLYSYNPNTNQLNNFGNILEGSDTSIQDLAVNDQYVYGSTAYGANIVAFNKQTGKKEFTMPTRNGKIAKSLAVDSENRFLYASSGPAADLFKWDLSSKMKTSIIADRYRTDSYAEKIKWSGDYLAIKFFPSKKGALYNLAKGTFINEFPVDSRGFSAKNDETNEMYYTFNGEIYALNPENNMVRNTFAKLPNRKNALSLDFVQLKDEPSRKLLTGIIDNFGKYYLYDPLTNELKIKTVKLPAQSVKLYLLFSDPVLKYVFANGFMTGGLTLYDPQNQTMTQLSGVNQLESALFINGKIYGGAYPNAKLIEITPQEQWDQSTVKTIMSLNTLGQERITALANSGSHLFAGTYSQSSTKGGLLLDYDIDTGSYRVYEDYITNQSTISLLNDTQYIYGGTSIHANYRVADFKAKFFRFRPENPSDPEYIYLPIQASMVMSLIKGPDGNIWGAADGTIFAYNPDTNKFRTVTLFKAVSGRFSNANLLVGKDGFIYGTIEGRLFKVNPADMSLKILLNSGAYQITQDATGNIYYQNEANLYRLSYQEIAK